MKMNEAMALINKPKGFMVSFEWWGDGFLRSDYFPDKHAGEALIASEEEAWKLAARFAVATKGKTCNIYVVDDRFSPVPCYEIRKIKNR